MKLGIMKLGGCTIDINITQDYYYIELHIYALLCRSCPVRFIFCIYICAYIEK